MLKIPPPRLLPATIAALAALLAVKTGVLLQTAVSHGSIPDSAMVAVANAAGTDQTREPAKQHAKPNHGLPPPAKSVAAPPPAQIASPAISASEKALLQELRQRRQELDRRAESVATRESMLIAAERKLTARVSELQALQKQLEGLDAVRKAKEDAGWNGLVKLYETMKPKDAATIFNDLSMPVLLQLLDRMKDSKAAPVMAAMNTDKARDVTAQLARLRTGGDFSNAPLGGFKSSLAGG